MKRANRKYELITKIKVINHINIDRKCMNINTLVNVVCTFGPVAIRRLGNLESMILSCKVFIIVMYCKVLFQSRLNAKGDCYVYFNKALNYIKCTHNKMVTVALPSKKTYTMADFFYRFFKG